MGYATSSILGYFDIGNVPILHLMRANLNAPLLGIAYFISMFFGGFNFGILALMGLLMYDGF